MNKLFSLFLNDGRFVMRDATLAVLAIAPFLMLSFIRFVLPFLADAYLPMLTDYYAYIIAMFCLIVAIFPAFAVSFMMLEEKDENIFAVLRVMPLSFGQFLAYRLTFVFVFGFCFSLLTLLLNGLVDINAFSGVGMAFLFALSGPIVALVVSTFAKNKVEGLTVLKGINFLLILPLLSIFVPSPWAYAFGVIPQYWGYQAFVNLSVGNAIMTPYGIGLLLHLIALAILVYGFKVRVFRQS